MPTIYLFSTNLYSIDEFLSKFFENKNSPNINIFDNYKISYNNPVEMSDLISAIIDNNDKYNISVWINLDKDLYLKVTSNNVNDIIKYLFERYPY